LFGVGGIFKNISQMIWPQMFSEKYPRVTMWLHVYGQKCFAKSGHTVHYPLVDIIIIRNWFHCLIASLILFICL
jgi:hypothetical protein